MRFLTILSLLFAPTLIHLNAEIQLVTLIWQPGLCKEPCVRLLYTQLGRVRGIQSTEINEGAGRAYIIWKPDVPFAFAPLNSASRLVGIRVNQILLKVRGEIVIAGNQIKLISSGDRTSFTLINPVIPNVNNASVIYNPLFRSLTPELVDKLLQAQKERLIVTIEGPFFEPFRSPPNVLTVEKITTEAPNKNKQK